MVAGYEDTRTFYQCGTCSRVWTMTVTPPVAGDRAPVGVLVADDSDMLVGLIACWLEDEGYAVVTATTGRQALDAAAAHRPDVVLLDLVMPPPDGFEVCAKLQRLPLPPEIILMTGVLDARHVKRAIELCAAVPLMKPLECESLVAAVDAAVVRHQTLHRNPTNPPR